MAEFTKEQLDLYGEGGPTTPIVKKLAPIDAPQGRAITPTVDELRKYASKKAIEKGLDPAIFMGLIDQESGWNAKARSKVGARGLTQLMPGTAKELGVDPDDPYQNIDGGAEHLARQLKEFGGDYQKALAAYNAGTDAVKKHGGIPPWSETQAYVPAVLANAEKNRKQGKVEKSAEASKPLWKDVAADPDVQKLSDEDYDRLRQRYFENVVTPDLKTEDIKTVHSAFMERTARPGMLGKMYQGVKDMLSGAGEPSPTGEALKPQAPQTPGDVAADIGMSAEVPAAQMPTSNLQMPDGQRTLDSNQVDVIMQGLNQRATEAANLGEKNFWVEPEERKALHAYLSQLPGGELKSLAQRNDPAGATVRKLIEGGKDGTSQGDWGPGIKVDDTWEITKGLKAGVVGMQQMGAAAGLVAMVNANRAIEAQLQSFDAIDGGQVPNPRDTPFPEMVGRYMRSDPAQRKAMRDKLFEWAGNNSETRGALLEAWKAYRADIAKINPRAADFTSLFDPKTKASFLDWLSYNTGQALPYSAAALVTGVLTGPMGLAGFGAVSGVGDTATNVMEAGGSPEQAANQQGLAISYAGLEFLGPVGKFVRAPIAQALRGMTKDKIEQIARGYFRTLGREVPKQGAEEFVNEWGQEMLNTKAKTNVTGAPYFTPDNLKDWFNAGAAGLAGSVATTGGITTGEHVMAKAKAELAKRTQEVGPDGPESSAPEAPANKAPKAEKPKAKKAEKQVSKEPSMAGQEPDVGGRTEPTMQGELEDLGGRQEPQKGPELGAQEGIPDKESHTVPEDSQVDQTREPTIGKLIEQNKSEEKQKPAKLENDAELDAAHDSMSQEARDALGQWVSGENAPGGTLDRLRNAARALWGGEKDAASEGDQQILKEIYDAGQTGRDKLAKQADKDGNVFLYRGLRKSDGQRPPLESYTTSKRVAENFAGQGDTVELAKVPVSDVVFFYGEAEGEVVVRNPLRAGENIEGTKVEGVLNTQPEKPSPGEPKAGESKTQSPEQATQAQQGQPELQETKPQAPENKPLTAAQPAEPDAVQASKMRGAAQVTDQEAEKSGQTTPRAPDLETKPLTPEATKLLADDEAGKTKLISKPKVDEIARQNGIDPEGKTKQQIIEELRNRSEEAAQQPQSRETAAPERQQSKETLAQQPEQKQEEAAQQPQQREETAAREEERQQEEKQDRNVEHLVSEHFSDTKQQDAVQRLLGTVPHDKLKFPGIVLEQVKAAGFEQEFLNDKGGLVSKLEFDPLIPERAQMLNDLGKAVAKNPELLQIPPDFSTIGKVEGSKGLQGKPGAAPDAAKAVREAVLRAGFMTPANQAVMDQAVKDYKGGHKRLDAIIQEMQALLQNSRGYGNRIAALGAAARETKAGRPTVAINHPFLSGRWILQQNRPRPDLTDPEIRDELRRMAKNAGWAEVGGRLMIEEKDGFQEVIGRTTWVAKESWWPQRSVSLNEKQTREAVRKALDGQPLTEREGKLIDYMVHVAKQTIAEWNEAAGTLDKQGFDAQPLMNDSALALAGDFGAEQLEPTADNMVDAELVAKATELNPDAVEAISDSLEPDAFMARIREIINESQPKAQGRSEANPETTGSQPSGGPASDSAVLAQAPQKAKRKLKKTKGLDQITVEVPVKTPEGEETTVEMQADEALSRIDADLQKLQEILDCLLA